MPPKQPRSARDASRPHIEQILPAAVAGDREAQQRLFEAVHAELRAMARAQLRCERPGHSWQPTELAHLVYLKLFTGRPLAHTEARWFYAAARRAMRELLIEHARARRALKRPDPAGRLAIDDVVLALGPNQRASFVDLDRCLARLKELSPRQHAVVELRYLLGLSWQEIAKQLEISVPTAEKDWQAARAWLRAELEGIDGEP